MLVKVYTYPYTLIILLHFIDHITVADELPIIRYEKEAVFVQ